jgi:NADPH-dependent curcumin reductase CurA
MVVRQLAKQLRIEGFAVLDFDEDYDAFRSEMAALWRAGALNIRQTIFEGLDSAPDDLAAFTFPARATEARSWSASPDTSVR